MKKVINWFLLIIFFTTNVIIPLPLYSVQAAQIELDEHQTSNLEVIDKITNIETKSDYVFDKNALNSFKHFNVYDGHIVNLYFPGGTENLINLVHNSDTKIDGTLNSIKNGNIGGNLYFLNPHGIMISERGIVNVGSLTAVTPTTDFMDNVFSSPGIINQQKIFQITEGHIPITENGLISVKGAFL